VDWKDAGGGSGGSVEKEAGDETLEETSSLLAALEEGLRRQHKDPEKGSDVQIERRADFFPLHRQQVRKGRSREKWRGARLDGKVMLSS